MKAADVMTRAVVAVDPEAPIAQAIRLMAGHKVSGLPVLDREGRLVGILSEGDLLRRTETGTDGDPPSWLGCTLMPGRAAARYMRTHARRVGEVMTEDVVAIAEDTPLQEVVELMRRHRVKRLPVVHDGRLVGIVSRADIVRRVGETLATETGTADDGTIRRAVQDAMDAQPWSRGNGIVVEITDGVVSLDGCLFNVDERAAMSVLVENVPGVKRVENRIICIEPLSGVLTYDPASAPTPGF